MTPCRATHGALTCCRTRPHGAPHMDHKGAQWDDDGMRVRPGRNPYREKEGR